MKKQIALDKKDYDKLEEDLFYFDYIKKILLEYEYKECFGLIRELDFLGDLFKWATCMEGYHPQNLSKYQYMTIYKTLHIMYQIVLTLYANGQIHDVKMNSEERKEYEKYKKDWWKR